MPRKTEHKADDPKEPRAHKAGSKKAKPSFSLPAETEATESAAGWVYRESDTAALPADEHFRDIAAQPEPVREVFVQDDSVEKPSAEAGTHEVTVTVVAHQTTRSSDAEPITASVSPTDESDYILGAATEAVILGVVSVGFAVLAVMRLMDISIAAGSSLIPGLRRSS